MSGNTKLVGFLNDNRVQLERWGVRAVVQLDPQSVDLLRAACFNDLPGHPIQKRTENLAAFRSVYDAATGRIHIYLSVNVAKCLGDLLVNLAKEGTHTSPEISVWAENLLKAVQDYKDTLSRKDEPGVSDE